MGARVFLSCTVLACLFTFSGSTPAPAEEGEDRQVQRTPDGVAPYPAPRSIDQVSVIDGRRTRYTVTVGAMPVKNGAGRITGEVVYTAYTVAGAGIERPVTFAINGGPGSASAYLNLGTMGPKRISFGQQEDTPSAPVALRDNPDSWLTFTDLVFIDPIGTGFSRTHLDERETDKEFFEADADIHYLSRVIRDWLVKEGRIQSRTYLVGESYGGYRVPRMAFYLQTELGIGPAGITMVSPYLDPPSLSDNDSLSPLPWLITLPSLAAADFERRGVPLTDAGMEPIEHYARTEFAEDFLAGFLEPAAAKRMSVKVAALTGLDRDLVQRMGGRIDPDTYLRETSRSLGKLGSINEPNLTLDDPFPTREDPQPLDPARTRFVAPLTSAMVDLVTRQIGWPIEGADYRLRAMDVNRRWKYDDRDSAVADLRKAIAIDPNMTVNIVHGWTDLNCPYFGSKMIVRQMPDAIAKNIRVMVYPGGHMFYTRSDSSAALRRDMEGRYR